MQNISVTVAGINQLNMDSSQTVLMLFIIQIYVFNLRSGI